MLRSALIALFVFCCLCPGLAQAERTAVLVTNASCPVQELRPLEIRKAYLGVAVRKLGRTIRPMRLNNDAALKQVFLQSVVAMSEKSYERRLLSLALKYGTPRPVEYNSVDALVKSVLKRDCAIAYMWQSTSMEYKNLKVLRLLWQGE